VTALTIPTLAQDDTPAISAPLILTDEQGEYKLGRSLDILEDPNGQLTFSQIASPEYASHFNRSLDAVPNFGYTSSVFWLRLSLRNEASLFNRWLLEVNFPNLNYVDLYLPEAGGSYQVKQSGVLRPFNTRDIPYYHVVFDLPLAIEAEQTIYIRVESGSSMTLAFTLWSPEAFAANKIADTLVNGLFYGALMMMLGYHLFAYFSLKEANYFYFILFITSSLLFFATYEGLADQFLWPGLSQQKLPFLVISMSLFFMASMKFGDVFLELKTQAPRFHRIFNLFLGLWGLMILIVPFLSFHIMALLTSVLLLATPAFAIFTGIRLLRKEYHPALFYLISWVGFYIGIMLAELVRRGILPSTPVTERFYHGGLIWLVLMWAFALADRINTLKADTESANRNLGKSQRQLSQILEGLPLGVTVYGPDRKPTYANQRAISILSNPDRGILPDPAAKRTLSQAMQYYAFRIAGSDQFYPIDRLPIWRAFEGRDAWADDIEADLVDRRVPLEIWANPVKDEHGRIESVLAAFHDITQRKQMQTELEDYQHQLESLVDHRTEQLTAANNQLQAEITQRRRLEDLLGSRLEWAVVVNQAHQTLTNLNDLPQVYKSLINQIKKMFSATDAFLGELDSRTKVLKLLAYSFIVDEYPDVSESSFPLPPAVLADQVFEEGKPIVFPREHLGVLDGPLGAHFRGASGHVFVLVPIYLQGDSIGLLGMEFLETERHFSADEIILIERICLDIQQIKERARLVEQARTMIAAETRDRLARDLHDSVTQMLFAASLVAEVLPQIWRRDPQKGLASLEEMRRLTRGALAEMRTLLLELRPAVVIKTPLGELLTQLTEALASRVNLQFRMFIEQIPPLPEDVHVGFYRVAQESLNNVVKHAHASQVSVSLSATPLLSDPAEAWGGEVKMMIRDDGCGFAVSEEHTQHLGLVIMHERASALGATLSLESQIGNGTTVTLTWSS
jgi:signal transduction histidine kinase